MSEELGKSKSTWPPTYKRHHQHIQVSSENPQVSTVMSLLKVLRREEKDGMAQRADWSVWAWCIYTETIL